MFSRNTQPSAASTGGWSSGPCERDSASASNPEYLFQSLGSSSFITRTTETTASPRTVDADIDRLLSEIHISSDGAKATTPSISEPPEEDLDSHESEPEQVADADVSVKAPATIGDSQFLMPPSQMPQTPPPIRVRNNLTINESNCNDEGRRPNPEAWKPPHEWDCTPTRRARSASPKDKIQHSPDSSNADHYMSPDIVALQREVKMMAMASPELILANIKAGMGDTSDTRVYKELEMTKKRWMFSALHQIGSYADLGLTDRGSDEGVPSRAHRILALYESQGKSTSLQTSTDRIKAQHWFSFCFFPSGTPSPGLIIASCDHTNLPGSLPERPANSCTYRLLISGLPHSTSAFIQYRDLFVDAGVVSLHRYSTLLASYQPLPSARRSFTPYTYRPSTCFVLNGTDFATMALRELVDKSRENVSNNPS